MPDLGWFFRDYNRRTAPLRRAQIVEPAGATQYKVQLENTSVIVTATVAHSVAALKAGQTVLVSRLAANDLPNGGFYIAAVTPDVQPPPTPSSSAKASEIVTHIDPLPLLLKRGSGLGVMLIYGAGLVTPPAYGAAGITDASAPVITSTLITLHLQASGSMDAGTYSLIVAGVAVAEALAIL